MDLFCFVVTKRDLVHNEETIFHYRLLLTAFQNLFWNMSDTIRNFMSVIFLEKIFWCCWNLTQAIYSLHVVN